MIRRAAALLALGLLPLAACQGEAPVPEAQQTEVPEEFRQPTPVQVTGGAEAVGTPMEERVATIGLVNKRNNISQDFEMKPGESVRSGDVIIRLAACEKPAPWEDGGMTGAFVQVFVNERADVDSERTWNRVFSGWMFKESPSLNVVEHPVYDVWIKDCAMTFPDEEAPAEDASDTTEA
ncbi:DUF2155 domain-containing protein [Aurantiacibacter luteus]|uniref:DUF2155 domain-containing protein n=1 Tax=Aurantiacibacter luteus TaxID=1581420 RepID=A0A0G9MZF3_9SPHN|nr:DUF2155 domain-containing protein [Aurantiacibacter luteus]KLE34633.1 hypothetical protein AAW00_10655 [Aurantiacibacter luteus]